MAPGARKPPRREADYSNIGVAGRKTGIVLKDTGIRDEHGMEPIDGIFSSPDKPPSTRKRRSGGSQTNTSESDMEIGGQSSIPDPSDLLRPNRTSLPLRRSRSPIKTNLGTPARRSVGLTSSPSKAPAGRALMNQSSSPNNRPFRATTMDSPARRPAYLRSSDSPKQIRPTKKRTFDLTPSEDEAPSAPEADAPMDDDIADVNDMSEEEDLPEMNGDESLHMSTDDDADVSIHAADEGPRKRGPVGKTVTDSVQAPSLPETTAPRKRGRPPGKKNATAGPPAKRAKKIVERPVTPEASGPAEVAPVSTPERNEMLPPPAKRGRKPKGAAAPAKAGSAAEPSKPRSRGLRILRSETPATDFGAAVMRSGRTSVKPMAFWRNERIVYNKGRIDGRELQLPGIKEVIRTEEMTPEPRPKSRRRPVRKRKAAEESDDDEDMEEWETEPGFLEGRVFQWDASRGAPVEDVEEDIELAFAPKGLEQATREVKNATFLYGKTVTLPFFHAGIVDLPAGGEKRPKNSRANHIVFWVYQGRVDVNVSDNQFSIGKGGTWQVPRGNFYGLRNSYDRPARVFFAQASYMQEEEAT